MDKRKFNRRPKGSKNKNPYPLTGHKSPFAKLWDVYQHGEFIGTYKSTAEVAKVIQKSPVRCWQIANGYQGNKNYGHPIVTQEGWSVLRHGEDYGWWLEE